MFRKKLIASIAASMGGVEDAANLRQKQLELVKAELLRLAQQGAPRPTGKLGKALTKFTTPPKK